MGKYILDLIARGEHQRQDFKFEINDARKIARTIVAFANTEGGKLLIGVKDNGRIAGVHSDEEYYMIETAATLFCKPEIKFTTSKWQVKDKTVLEVDIPKGTERPYLARTEENKWMSYVRVNDQNFLANAIQLKVWKNEKRKKGIFLEFTKNEKILLDHLRENSITLSHFTRISGLPRKRASDILVKLIGLDLIEINYIGQEINYTLKKTQSPEL